MRAPIFTLRLATRSGPATLVGRVATGLGPVARTGAHNGRGRSADVVAWTD